MSGTMRWRKLAVLVCAAALILVALAPASVASADTTAAAAKKAGTIVFQTASGGPIYLMNADGSHLRYLTTGMDPALSPDGRWVAFTRWQGQSNGVAGSLWVTPALAPERPGSCEPERSPGSRDSAGASVNVDGSGERQVMSGANQAKSPTWSSDGQKIVISMQQGGTVDDVWMCLVDGKPTQVPQPIAGTRCMPQRADPHWGLRVVDVTAGAYEDLPHSAHSFAPTWDPANAWHVVFRGDRGLENLDLNQKTTWLLKETGAQRGPVFSPDGKKIATTFKQNDHWEVHVMNADGSGEVRLTETPMSVIVDAHLKGQEARQWNNAAPAWSPDGTQISFLSDRNGSYEILGTCSIPFTPDWDGAEALAEHSGGRRQARLRPIATTAPHLAFFASLHDFALQTARPRGADVQAFATRARAPRGVNRTDYRLSRS